MNKWIRKFFTHPLMRLVYGVIIIAICYFAYAKAYTEVVSKYYKLTRIEVLTFDSSEYEAKMEAFKETKLEIIYPIGQKSNISSEDAKIIAEKSLKASLQKNVAAYMPFTYYFDEKSQLYMIEGSEPLKLLPGEKPGHPYLIIQKKDGRVVAVWTETKKK